MSSFDRLVRRALYRGLFPAVFPRPRRVPFADMRRLLVFRCDAIGDMILTTPLLHALHRRNPRLKIWVAASDRNAEVITHDPAVERVVILEDQGKLRRGAVGELRSHAFQAVFQCVTNSTTKYGALARYIAPHAITAALVHSERPEYAGLFSDLVDVPDMYARPFSEIMMEFPRQVFGLPIPDEECIPEIIVEPAAERAAEAFFASAGIARRTAILVNLSAGQERKRWPGERYAALLRMLAAAHLPVVLSAVGDDRVLAESLMREVPAALFPAANIRQLTAAVERCAMVVTPDTSVVHVAAATGTPVVGLYAEARSVVQQWLPYRVPYRAVRTDEYSVAPITADQVFDAVRSLRQSISIS